MAGPQQGKGAASAGLAPSARLAPGASSAGPPHLQPWPNSVSCRALADERGGQGGRSPARWRIIMDTCTSSPISTRPILCWLTPCSRHSLYQAHKPPWEYGSEVAGSQQSKGANSAGPAPAAMPYHEPLSAGPPPAIGMLRVDRVWTGEWRTRADIYAKQRRTWHVLSSSPCSIRPRVG